MSFAAALPLWLLLLLLLLLLILALLLSAILPHAHVHHALFLFRSCACSPSFRRGGIADVVENAAQLAARLDTTVKKTGTQKRDIDYISEYLGFVKEFDETRKKAESSGAAFDEAGALNKIKAAYEIEKVDAELDASLRK